MYSTNNSQHQTLDVINIMEVLVLEEVDDQLVHRIAPQLAKYVKRMEVATYALNRLPALYASSQEGVYYQVKRAKARHSQQIGEAVSQGIAAVLRDPLKTSTPLTPATLSKIQVKLNLPPKTDETPVREIRHQTFADRRHQQEQAEYKLDPREMAYQAAQESRRQQEQDEYKSDPRDLAYQAAQELRVTLRAKQQAKCNTAFTS